MSFPTRVLLRFTWTGSPIAGFSERYDFELDSDGETAAREIAMRVAIARAQVLANNWSIWQVAVGRVAPKLSAKTGKHFAAFTKLQLCPEVGPAVGKLGTTDTPWQALYVLQKFQGASHPVARQLRGVPDTFFDGGVTTRGVQVVNKFFDFLLTVPQYEHRVNKTTGAMVASRLICSTIQRISSRRTGRPFLPLRGRRSKRPA